MLFYVSRVLSSFTEVSLLERELETGIQDFDFDVNAGILELRRSSYLFLGSRIGALDMI